MINWKKMKPPEYIVIHCSATAEGEDVSAEDIRGWHLQRGWLDIGYHKVIRRDGTVENGRALDVPGAHARGFNNRSWGICLVGGVESDNKTPEANFTHAQWEALEATVRELLAIVPTATVLGHRDLPRVSKACPSFDAVQWWSSRENSNVLEYRGPQAD